MKKKYGPNVYKKLSRRAKESGKQHRYSSETAKAAINKRWAKYREEKAREAEKEGDKA